MDRREAQDVRPRQHRNGFTAGGTSQGPAAPAICTRRSSSLRPQPIRSSQVDDLAGHPNARIVAWIANSSTTSRMVSNHADDLADGTCSALTGGDQPGAGISIVTPRRCG